MWARVESIRTSTFFILLGYALISTACAKGTEIGPNEIILLPILPQQAPDASTDAGVAPASVATPPADVPPAAPPAQ